MSTQSDAGFTAFIGLDWADAKHDFCLQPADSDEREFGTFAHQPEAIDAWARGLHQRFGGRIAIALELAKGPVVYALQKYDFLVLFPIDPSLLAKYRQAFKPSRAKDDPTDAQLALELMQRYPHRFTPLKPQSVAMRTLGFLVEQRRLLVDDKKRLVNRLGHTLKQYYPQVLEWFEQHDTVVFSDFLLRWPTLKQVKRARQATLEAFFRDHNVRSAKVVAERVQAIQTAMPLTEDPAVITTHQLLALALVEQLQVALQAIDRFDRGDRRPWRPRCRTTLSSKPCRAVARS